VNTFKIAITFTAALLIGSNQSFGQTSRPLITEASDGGSVLTKYTYDDIDKDSTLHRSWYTINGSTCPIQLVKAGVKTEQGIGASHLVYRPIVESFVAKEPIIQALGYRDVERGLRRLTLLEQGEGSDRIIKQIAAVYPAHAEELQKALTETAQLKKSLPRPYRVSAEEVREIEERERRRFRPFLWVHTEDGAHSFWTAVAERQVKVLWFQDGFERMSETEKLAAVRERIREHYEKTGGKYIGFGAIQRYTYSETFDTSIVFDTAGNVIEEHGGRSLLPEVWLELY
jgi:hypothetical protein